MATKKTKPEQDATEYLLNSEANAERLLRSVKQVQSQQLTEHQQILEHFGENSAEYAEAKAKAEKE